MSSLLLGCHTVFLVPLLRLDVFLTNKDVDGAYFGTTFPHLFLMTYGHLKPKKPTTSYIPRVFGFKIHKS
ncbi:hypothetical protein MLD38_023780 [Melastoma candidum]|uniref:Uncharacterized protein n=1 Tax=Melastoma candidum TaxID=119954 RepID=A0ACB9NWX7_9MYRT|nr:hypothetical protein MLD38_023780 [Melastoma candidum]